MREKSFYKSLVEAKASAVEQKNTIAVNLINRVSKYILRGSFSSYKKAGTISRLFLDGASDPFVALTLGISESTVRVQRRNLSKELYFLFGNDFFDILKELPASKVAVSRRIYLVESMNKEPEELFFVEFLSLLKGSVLSVDTSEVDIKECGKEISFLVNNSRAFIGKELSALKPENLGYLLGVIEGNRGTESDRFNLLRLITEKEGTV